MTEPITDEIRVVSGSSSLGLGFHEDSLNRALALKPHFIGCDGGSSDPGPTYLGRGLSSSPLSAIKRDLRLLVLGGQKNKIPVMIGSCGTAGGAPHLDRVFGALKEIVKEEKLNLKVALIHSEQDKDYLKEKYRAGKIHELGNAPPFDEDVIDRSERIVGCSGAEPFQKALEMGADVVLAGRASDTAIFASFPTLHGFPPGPAWHAAKILECGAASVKQRKTPDCMFAWIRKDHFDVSPLDPDLACSPQSIASHSLYENNDPFEIKENAGTINLTKASYKAIDDRSVRVSGSQFIPAEIHTVKLEGAEFAGYQAITPGS
ncbi:MAG: acyclic terpene utilization AtuA family protein, partial [Rhodospirillales bacterium]